MNDYPKRIKKQLRRLVGEAYENELTQELGQLATKFDEWKAGKISTGELSRLIHEYYTGPSWDMYKYYNNVSPVMAVGRAVVERLLEEDDIPEEVWPYIQNAVQFYRDDLGYEEETEESGTERA